METTVTPHLTPPAKPSSRILLVALIFFIGLLLGRYALPASTTVIPTELIKGEDSQRQLVFPTFWEAWDKLHDLYIGDLDDTKLLYGAVEGMVRAAGDPYTSFANPQDAKLLNETLEGSFSGVGIEIGLKNGLVTVIAPIDGSPAQKAGILEGDIIVAIDKEPLTESLTIDQVVQKIRGPKNTPVTLTVIAKQGEQTRDITMTRDTIVIESVKSSVENGLGIIKITNFNGDTSARFNDAARSMIRQNVKGVILDLRGNPGGYLDSAVDVSSQFLEGGKLVVSEKGKTSKEYKSKGQGLLKDMPVVALVDGGSASASEITAGALKDQRQTPIIGARTFGKGVVQELLPLRDGSSLKVTIAEWFTPNGSSINEEGIEPTIAIEQNRDTPEDEQLIRAKEELSKSIAP
ncbi:MAG: S41 family peptidase [Candidatus Andersenbacteria bacterium]|nr:S41 family peptidase [Candidatus Andersenbacteria bacterium]